MVQFVLFLDYLLGSMGFFDSSFFQSVVTLFVGIGAIFFAYIIGKKQNSINEKFLNLNSAISLVVGITDKPKELLFTNRSKSNGVIFYRIKIGKTVINTHNGKNFIPPETEIVLSIEEQIYNAYFSVFEENEYFRTVPIEVNIENALREKYTAKYNFILERNPSSNKVVVKLQIIDYEKGWD